jgi:amino-acid N-acetyltransferase
MEDMTFRAGEKSDIRRIKSLLKSADLPYEDIDLSRQDFIVAVQNAKIIGAVGLEPYEEYGLLRSLAVEDAYRGEGLGRALVAKMIAHSMDRGIKQLYLLTLTADRFFDKEGFERISRESMPEAIKNTSEFKSICPVSSICMKKEMKS